MLYGYLYTHASTLIFSKKNSSLCASIFRRSWCFLPLKITVVCLPLRYSLFLACFSEDVQGRSEGLLVFPQHTSSLKRDISAGTEDEEKKCIKLNSCYCFCCLHKILHFLLHQNFSREASHAILRLLTVEL